MDRETLSRLYIRLNGLRNQRRKEKFFFQRKKDPVKGELIRVAFAHPRWRNGLGLTNYLPPVEMIRWLEGCVYGFNSCWYNTTNT